MRQFLALRFDERARSFRLFGAPSLVLDRLAVPGAGVLDSVFGRYAFRRSVPAFSSVEYLMTEQRIPRFLAESLMPVSRAPRFFGVLAFCCS